jgi:hypothetical protein
MSVNFTVIASDFPGVNVGDHFGQNYGLFIESADVYTNGSISSHHIVIQFDSDCDEIVGDIDAFIGNTLMRTIPYYGGVDNGCASVSVTIKINGVDVADNTVDTTGFTVYDSPPGPQAAAPVGGILHGVDIHANDTMEFIWSHNSYPALFYPLWESCVVMMPVYANNFVISIVEMN